MSDYQRYTVRSIHDVLRIAEDVLPTRGGLQRTRGSEHSATYTGPEGTLIIEAHRHGTSTEVVVRTNQLRTSKIDIVARYFMNQLAYQTGDPARE